MVVVVAGGVVGLEQQLDGRILGLGQSEGFEFGCEGLLGQLIDGALFGACLFGVTK